MNETSRLEGAGLIATLTDPAGIAIVGASDRDDAYAYRALRYLLDFGYAGELVLVNPKRSEILGLPCVPKITDMPPADAALVAIPAGAAPQACAELAAVGVKVAVVIAGHVTGAHRDVMRHVAASSPMRIIGPNGVGTLATKNAAYLTFSRVVEQGEPRAGSVALVTQSGAVGNAMLLSLVRRGGGVSHWISSGDEVDVGALELATGLIEEEDVRAVGLFLEAMVDVEWLPRLRDAVARTGKPVVAVKGAVTNAGRNAAAGHTGRVVGSGEVSVATMREAGILVADDLAHATDILLLMDVAGRPRGGRVGIVTISGGSGVLAADRVTASASLQMAPIDADSALTAKLGGRVHAVTNPLDVAGSPTDVFGDWTNSIADDRSCDIVLAIQANILHDERVLAERLAERSTEAMRVVVPFSEEDPLGQDAVARLTQSGIPVLPSADRAIAALSAIAPGPPAAGSVTAGHEATQTALDGLEAAIALFGSDLPWARYEVVGSLAAAGYAAAAFGYPVVLKAAGRTLHHRSEAGAVMVGVTPDELVSAYSAVAGAAERSADAVLVQEQVAAGVEVMVSVIDDPELGLVAIVRPGGRLTELMNGSAILWHGWDRDTKRAAIDRSVVGLLIGGYRGTDAAPPDALLELVEQLLTRAEAKNVRLLELNPVIVSAKGVHLIDALVAADPDL